MPPALPLTLPGKIVKKSNAVIRSRVKLDDVTAGRIFASVISCIRKEDKDFLEYNIPATSIIVDTGGNDYTRIKNALRQIISTTIEMPLSDGPNPDFAIYPLFSKAEYKKGVIKVSVHPDLKPHFIKLAEHFTEYSLMKFLMLSTTYSQRLYEILQSYSSLPECEIPLEKLHMMLNTTQSLQKDYAQFRRRVLEPTHKEIKKKCPDLQYTYIPVKRGKAVEKLIFLFGTTQKALVASQEQKIADTRKIAQQNNKTFLKALSCAEKKNGKCTKQDNTKRTCEVCVSCNLCDEIIKKMKTITSTGNKNIDPELDAWSERVLEGMRRMSTDEKFRKEIESKIT